ncbi:MAG: T9SS type A sorting domain-containing protein [Saprospiraceae bacterium]|nr:T9SS type A sorting domain-containing protein [Saprospiraceae bacterium]
MSKAIQITVYIHFLFFLFLGSTQVLGQGGWEQLFNGHIHHACQNDLSSIYINACVALPPTTTCEQFYRLDPGTGNIINGFTIDSSSSPLESALHPIPGGGYYLTDIIHNTTLFCRRLSRLDATFNTVWDTLITCGPNAIIDFNQLEIAPNKSLLYLHQDGQIERLDSLGTVRSSYTAVSGEYYKHVAILNDSQFVAVTNSHIDFYTNDIISWSTTKSITSSSNNFERAYFYNNHLIVLEKSDNIFRISEHDLATGSRNWIKDYPQLTNLTFHHFIQSTDGTAAFLLNDLLIKFNPIFEIEWIHDLGASTQLNTSVFFPWKGVIPTTDNGFLVYGDSHTSTNNTIEVVKIDGDGDIYSSTIKGYLFLDDNNDCTLNNGEDTLGFNWIVEVQNPTGINYGTVDANGYFEVAVPATTNTIRVVSPNNYWGVCPSQTVTVNLDEEIDINMGVTKLIDAPLLSVNMSTPMLRRCFQNTYTIEYCNNGTQTATDIDIEVIFDEDLIVDATTLGWTYHQDSLYLFELDSIEVGACGSFQVYVTVDCDSAVLGEIHCSSVHIYPDTIFNAGNSLAWDGSDLQVTGTCVGDSIVFNIENVGLGNMGAPLQYIVIEDEIMMRTDSFQLDTNEVITITIAANASSYRLETPQSDFHPYRSLASASVQGCNTTDVTNFVLQFPLDEEAPFYDMDCMENIGSYDPNDKTGFPYGLGTNHLIDPNTSLDYHIRFQNTGTDTAINIVIIDTISNDFELSTFTVLGASDPYTWRIYGQGILEITFNQIMLPDSNINEPESHGYFRFNIRHKVGLPLGTELNNTADIYFDFNEPIRTNTTSHIIQKNFLLDRTQAGGLYLNIAKNQIIFYPNPMTGLANIQVLDKDVDQYIFQVFDAQGRLLHTAKYQENQFSFSRNELAKGLYFYRVIGDNKLLGSGKFSITD